MMILTGIYRFIYRRFQFETQTTILIIAQTLVGVLLIWGLDIWLRCTFPSTNLDNPIAKFAAIAAWVVAFNIYKFNVRSENKRTEIKETENRIQTESSVHDLPTQESESLHFNTPVAPIEEVTIVQPVEKEAAELNFVAPVAPFEDIKIVKPVEKEIEQLNFVTPLTPIEAIKDGQTAEIEAVKALDQPILVNVEEEMADVQQYLSIEKIRLGDKLNYTLDIEEAALNQKVPPHIIQTLVANAIKHGVQEATDGGYVNIQSYVYDGFLTIEIKNSGQLKTDDPSLNEPSESRVNIENTIKRLSELFGENGFFSIENDGDSEVVATMCVPVAH